MYSDSSLYFNRKIDDIKDLKPFPFVIPNDNNELSTLEENFYKDGFVPPSVAISNLTKSVLNLDENGQNNNIDK